MKSPTLGWFPAIAGLYAVAGGTLTLLGWMLDVPQLTDWESDGIAMQPNAGVVAILTGAALILLSYGGRRVAAGLGVLSVSISAATLLEHAFGLDLGIDRLLSFDREWGTRGTVAPGRMGIPGALSWTLSGLGLIALRRREPTSVVAPVTGMVVTSVAALSLIGYVFQADLLYAVPRLTAIAWRTATMLLLVGLALIAIARDRQPMRLLTADDAGGALVRRALPVVVLVPVVVGFLCVRGHTVGLYDASMGFSLLVIALILTLGALLWWGATAVTHRERSLRRSEERFSRFMEHLPGLAWIKDQDGRYRYANGAAQNAFSVSHEELYGRTDDDIFPAATAAQFRANDREALARGQGIQFTETLIHDDGLVHHSLVSKFPLADRTGDPAGIGGMAIDITERKRAEETVSSLLRISSRLNSTLSVDQLLDILVLEARDLVGAEAGVAGLRTAEGMVCEHYFRKDEILPLEYCWPPMHGLPGWLIVHKVPYLTNDAENDRQIVQALCDRFEVWSALSTPIISATGEVLGFFEVHNKKDGSPFTGPDRDALVAVSQIAAIAVQNALAYRSLQEAEESLKQSDRRKDDFLATLAHELRNPLAPIRNAVELMRRADDEPALRGQARSLMERQVGQMVRLVDDLLDISRITRGKMQLRQERVELAAVVESAIETARPSIDASSHELSVSLSPEPIVLFADPTRLAQVFSNLLNNAAKFTDKGGHLWLTAERQAAEAIVSVRDTGIGIGAEHLPRVFEMFSQAAPALERSHGGLGIGLSLVRGLVELHGGRVEVRSAGPGLGSEFIVRLPLVEVPGQPGREPVDPGEKRSDHPGCRILVVDDNRDAADSTATMLRLMGHATHAAYDGVEAVQAAATFRPSVVLLDIGLPKLNGYEAARRIRKEPWGKEMTLIALTGWGQEEDKRRALEAGCDHHLTKPVDAATLEKLVGLIAPRRPQSAPVAFT